MHSQITPSQIFTVKIEDLSRGGSGVAHLDDGRVVFVPFTLTGDVVQIEIIETEKNYSQGKLIQIIQPSPERVEPKCAVFGTCGGCAWQHVPYKTQLATKLSGVTHALKRAGLVTQIEPECIGAMNPFHYRNRIQMRGDPIQKKMGFYAKGSNQTIDAPNCPVAQKEINDALPNLRAEAFKKFTRPFKLEIQVEETGEVFHSWNQKHAARGFGQVNHEQNQELRNWIRKALIQPNSNRKNTILYDLFGGAGNLSLGIASEFSKVYCVDIGSPIDSQVVAPENFELIRSDVLKWLKTSIPPSPEPSCAILDPPREGLGSHHFEIQKRLKELNVQTLALVGCDPDAFARDAFRFTKQGWQLAQWGIIDLFPQTPHVESLAVFVSCTE